MLFYLPDASDFGCVNQEILWSCYTAIFWACIIRTESNCVYCGCSLWVLEYFSSVFRLKGALSAILHKPFLLRRMNMWY